MSEVETMSDSEKYARPEKSRYGKYLFCYFVGNEPEQERIHFAVSRDGYNFSALNGNREVIVQTLGTKCVRDPFILRANDGYFYIIATDMKCTDGWTSNHALISWKSADLVNWTDETVIDIRAFGGRFATTTRAWAPQAVFDKSENKYMVYWAHTDAENDSAAMYYAYTTDFKALSKPHLLYERRGIQTIDADIIYNEKNKKYYMYFKHDEDQKIAYVTSDCLTGPYRDEPETVSLAETGVEGSCMYNINGTDTWVLIMDEYGKNRYFAQQTTDFENFKALKKEDYSMDISPRHGYIIEITDDEYEQLLKAYPER